MATNTTELILRFRGESGDLKSTMAQVRSEVAQTTQASQNANKSELSMRQQLAAVQALQRQRSAALYAEWKRTERAATSLATGVRPVGQNLQRITDIMQTLGASSATLTGPLGGVAGRLRSLGSLATEAGGGIGIAGAAIGALAVAAVGASIAIYKLTVQTAEFQGKMYDLSQQTGVSVETLSALEILATTTGGSIDSITASLGIFQRNLEDAQVSTSKEAKLLKELGVETDNTEHALRQTLAALARMPEGFQQTSDALTLFGRGGKQVLAILKEMDGDLDGAIKRFREMGILIDTKTAKAADEFNDQLAVLGFQLRAVVALVGREAMPTILRAIESVSKAIVDNRQVISGWAKALGDAGQGALILGQLLWKLNGIITGLGQIPIPAIFAILKATTFPGQILTLLQGVNEQFGVNPLLNMGVATGAASAVGDLAVPKGGRARAGGKAKKSPRDTSMQDAIKEAELAEREIRQKIEADIFENKRALENHVREIEEFTRRAIELSDQQLNATIDRINAEIAALDAGLAKKLIKQREYDRKQKELDIETATAVQKNREEISELEDRRDREIAESELNAHKRSVQLADEASDRLIKIIQDRIDRQEIAESEGEKQIADLVARGYQRRKELLEDELDDFGTTLERKKEINDELIRLDGERADAAVRAARRIQDAQEMERPRRPRRVADEMQDALGRIGEGAAEGLGLPQELSVWDEALGAMIERMQSFHDASRMYVVDAFHGMASAAQDAVQAWILYGGSLGKALKQALAAELAAIAARATIQAALHAAYAIGSLAFGNFAAAAQHGIAALKFAAVAAATGFAARGLAVSAQSGTATAESAFQSARGVGQGSTAGQPTTIDVNRRVGASAQPQVTVILQGEIATEALKIRVVDAVVESLDLNDERLTKQVQGAAIRAR